MTIGALAPRLLGDAGTGWHIRNGELILRTRSITRTDPFSATMNAQPWYAWEWLYDAGIAGIHQWAGLNGVVFLTALVIASSFTLTFCLTLRRGGSLLISLVLLIVALGASAIHLFARPHVFSWLLALIWFWLLDGSETAVDPGKTRRVFWLPVIMLFWVNVHGGFVLGFVLCGIYLAAGLVSLWRTRDSSSRERVSAWLRRLAGVTGVALFAGLVNPFGYKLYVHVYQYLSDRFLMNHIDEFRSPDFHGLAQQCFAALLLITIVALAAGGRRLRTSQLLVILFAAYSGLYASRSLPVSSLLLTLILSPLLSQTLADASADVAIMASVRRVLSRLHDFSQRMTRTQAGFRGHLWPALAVLMGLTVCLHHGMLGSRQLMHAHFSEKRFPVEAVNVIGAARPSSANFQRGLLGRISHLPALSAESGVRGRPSRLLRRCIPQALLEDYPRGAGMGGGARSHESRLHTASSRILADHHPQRNAAVEGDLRRRDRGFVREREFRKLTLARVDVEAQDCRHFHRLISTKRRTKFPVGQ